MNRLLLVSALAIAQVAFAAPTSTCAMTSSTTAPFLGETFQLTVSMTNNGTSVGYAPAVEMFMPAGLTITGAQAFGIALTVQNVGTVGGGNTIVNPYTNETVTSQSGRRFYLIRFPLSSLAPAAGTQVMTIDVAVAAPAVAGTALSPNGTCLFALGGIDALNNPATDAPVRSDVRTSGADQTSVSVTPSNIRVTHRASVNTTVTGPNWPVSWIIEVDAATGVTVTGTTIDDVIPDSFQLTAVTAPSGTVNSPSTIPLVPGGTVNVTFPSITGAAGVDRTITITGYVPRLRTGGLPVISASTGASVTLTNTATVSGATVGATAQTVPSAQASFGAHSILIREAITNQSRPSQPFRPGDVANIAQTVQVSDYFNFNANSLVTTLADGLTYVAASSTPLTPVSVTGSDPTTLTWNLGARNGTTTPPGTSVTNALRATVDEVYLSLARVQGGDVIPTTHQLTSTIDLGGSSGSTIVQTEAVSGSDDSVTVGRTTGTKIISAVNGSTTIPSTLEPGDVVTFQIGVDFDSGDQLGLTLTDYLPSPIFQAEQHGNTPAFGSGVIRFGSGNSVEIPAPTVSISPSSANNSITFTFPSFQTAPSKALHAEVLIDYTVRNEPQEDGLRFANLVQGTVQGTSVSFSLQSLVIDMVVDEPSLRITHGARGLGNNSSGTLNPATVPALPYTSANITTNLNALRSVPTNIDASDTIDFQIVVDNTGNRSAYDVQIADTLPTGLTLTGVVTVTDGNGLAVATTGDLFTPAGLTLTLPLPPVTAAAGTNVVVIRYTVSVDQTVAAGQAFVNTGRVVSYASTASGPNFVGSTPQFTSAVSFNARRITLTKRRTTSASTTALNLPIRGTAAWEVIVNIPEGTTPNVIISDTFPTTGTPALPVLAVTNSMASTALPALVTQTGVDLAPTIGLNGVTWSWNMGTVTNTNSTAAGETFTITFDTVVLNNTPVIHAVTATNSAVASWGTTTTTQTSTVPASNNAQIRVVEPNITITSGTVAPTTADQEDVVTVTFVVANDNARGTPAYDAQFAFTLPPELDTLTNLTVTGTAPTTSSSTSTSIDVDWASLSGTQTATISFQARVKPGVTLGTTVNMNGTMTWSSQPGTPAQATYTQASITTQVPNGTERTTYSATLATAISLQIRATSLVMTLVSGNTHAVGSTVTYRLTLTVPEGGSASASITDQLPAGLIFRDTLNTNVSSGITCTPACAIPTAGPGRTVSADGRTVTWNLGTVSNNNNDNTTRTIAFDVRAVVADVVSNTPGTVLINQSALNAGALANGPSITVIQPSFTATTSTLTAAGRDSGDTVQFQTRLQNAAGANAAVAHDVTIDVPLSGKYAWGSSVTASSGTCPLPTVTMIPPTGTATTARMTFTSINTGVDCTYTYSVILRDTTSLGELVSATGQVRWTTQAGDVSTPIVTGFATTVERAFTSAQTLSYQTAGTSAVTIAKTLVSTSSTDTSGTSVAIGEDAVWRLRVTLPEGTHPNIKVRDTPPAGLRIVSVSLSTTGFGGTVGTNPTNAALNGTSGQVFTFDLGTVTVTGDNVTTNNFIDLVVTTRGVFDAAALTSGSVSNAGAVLQTGAPFATNTSPVTLVFPQPRITIASSNATPAAGDSTNITVTLRNNGTAPVCNTNVSYPVPAGFTVANATTDTLDNDGDSTTDEADEGTLLASGTVTLPITGCLAPSTTRTFVMRLTANAAIPPTSVTLAATLASYETLSTTGATLSPTTDGYDNNNDTTVDGANDARVTVTINPRAPAITFTKTATDQTAAPVVPNDTVRYTISVANTGNLAATGVSVSDTIPAGVDIVGSPTVTAGTATASLSGSVLTIAIGSLAASSTVTVTIDVKVKISSIGTNISNQASLTTTDTYGPRQSDDPSTAASNDATVFSVAAPDTDGDHVPDYRDPEPNNPAICGSSDADTCDDCSVANVHSPNNDGPDADADGMCDTSDPKPNDTDADDDGVGDSEEQDALTDSDGDGLINVLDPDSDNDGVFDGTELGKTTPLAGTDVIRGNFVPDGDSGATKTDPTKKDTDNGGVNDGAEDTNKNGVVDTGELDPRVGADDTTPPTDTDGDGLTDAEETLNGLNPNDADTDDDGVIDGQEPNWRNDTDGDGLINALDVDSDNDGIFDGTEANVTTAPTATDVSKGFFVADGDSSKTNPLIRDTDTGGVSDGAEDVNHNGKVDTGERDPLVKADDTGATDTDGDGLTDEQENAVKSNPNDADTDDDGIIDGQEPNWWLDTDGDGLINVLDADSDNDGLFDGTELGVTTAPTGTDVSRGRFVADADPTTRTSPLLADTDFGGLSDAEEDLNRNGKIDTGEKNPRDPADDSTGTTDTDGDGLTDALENAIHTNPNDADTDDDGVRDGAEPNFAEDTDRDGLINALDVDSDNDGLFDGTELGVTTAGTGTDATKGFFKADEDPATKTHPLLRDTDRGGVTDGAEDVNRNGKVDTGEINPLDPADDSTVPTDTDGDGLSDVQERSLGLDPNDDDTDDDGVIDGGEPNFSSDSDGDGLINALDPDSDNDGLFDGTELGVVTPANGTNLSRNRFVVDADPATKTNPLLRDTDLGGIIDGIEDVNRNGRVDTQELNPNNAADDTTTQTDTDGDGLSDAVERFIGTNPNDNDTDDDGIIDGAEANFADDADGDGAINARDPDSDNDGIFDGTENGVTMAATGTDVTRGVFIADADPTTRTNPLIRDSDAGGLSDGAEDVNRNGKVDAGEKDPRVGADDGTGTDTDMDGLTDAQETAIGSNPNDADTDDDGVIDGQEPNFAADADQDGLPNVLDVDSDNDGIFDGTEMGVNVAPTGTNVAAGHFIADADPTTKTSPVLRDTDAGGVPDGAEDPNRNGQIDSAEGDPRSAFDDNRPPSDFDGDGLTNDQELSIGSDPTDADSDDDGVIDGLEPNYSDDADGDGRKNVVDADADNDGLFDGTELGVTMPNKATDVTQSHYIADADPTTKTNPLIRDTDKGGVNDGSEDLDKNGRVDMGETNPLDAADDSSAPVDTDGDGLLDAEERTIGTDPNDSDSDDDGVVDGDEDEYRVDTDRDGLINALDPDSDGDLLFDGTERGVTTAPAGTDTSKGRFIPDADPTTKTQVLKADSDNGGVSDGAEDTNRNGKVDTGERDPLNASDDVTPVMDSDGDGLGDDQERSLNLNPNDADSDDDGVIDGQEPNVGDDTDGDGLINGLDADSDNDGLFDGTERGVAVAPSGTDVTKGNFIPDADPGTTTNPLLKDTDKGGVSDGDEDENKNGKVDEGERDPRNAGDDNAVRDIDTDGVLDARDNCPEKSNADQLDKDKDGLGDACDTDADGDGFKDEIGVRGGGCSTTVTSSALFLVLIAVAARRRRA